MKELGLWPSIERGAGFAEKYLAINGVLRDLAQHLEIDLWTLDALWWGIEIGSDAEPQPQPQPQHEDIELEEQTFGLEIHLHDFLADNWDQTDLGRDWALHEDEGELVGYRFNTREVGEIDLLARHRSEPKWLVVELKRGRTSDYAVGQALRYRGWVRRHLAGPDEIVEAVVISHQADPKLMYALDGVEGISALTYSVQFSVREPRVPWNEEPGGI